MKLVERVKDTFLKAFIIEISFAAGSNHSSVALKLPIGLFKNKRVKKMHRKSIFLCKGIDTDI